MPRQLADTRRLFAFYGGDDLRGGSAARPGARWWQARKVKPADLYTRSLDCQNHGGYAMLERWRSGSKIIRS